MAETHQCAKCGKEKPASQVHIYEGNTYCCETCCGNVSTGEHKEKKAEACEFC